MDGFHVVPQQEGQDTLSEDEEEGNGKSSIFSAALGSDPDTAAFMDAQREVALFNHLLPGAEEERGIAAPPTTRCRRWSVTCGRRTLSSLRFVRTTARVTVTLFAAFLVILVTYWALSPLCTSCARSWDGPAFGVVVPAADETGWSTLRINQLQVSGEVDLLAL